MFYGWVGLAGHNFTTDPLNPNPSTHDSDTWRGNVGLKGDIGDTGWTFDASYVKAENDFFLSASDGVASRLQAALLGLGGPNCSTNTPGENGCQFFNPFGNGLTADASAMVPVLNADFTPVIGSDGNILMTSVRNTPEMINWLQGEVTLDIKSKLDVFDAVVTGDLFEMPAGTVGAAFGIQYRDTSLSYDYDDFTNTGDFLFVQKADDFVGTQDTYAVFGEVLMPLASGLELSAALRYEDYGGQVGSTLDPKLALLWNPSSGLSLRATYSSSFRAPSVFQQFGNQTSLNAVDDVRSESEPFISIQTSGFADLQPETSGYIHIWCKLGASTGVNI